MGGIERIVREREDRAAMVLREKKSHPSIMIMMIQLQIVAVDLGLPAGLIGSN